LLAGILSIPKYIVNLNQLVATNNKFKSKNLRIRPELVELLKLKGTKPFSIVDLCKEYFEIPGCNELTKQQIRQFIIRNIKRLENSGLALKMPQTKGSVTRYKLTANFHDGQYIIGLPHCKIAPVENNVCSSLLEKLENKLAQYQISLIVTLSEIEEYKNLGLQNPSVKAPLQSLYTEARDRCSKLLGKVKATESLIAEIHST